RPVRLAPCMTGARPTIRSRPWGSPNEGTGALNQVGSRARASSRKPTSLGQSGQLRSGSVESRGVPASAGLPRLLVSVVEIVVIAPRRRGGGALQELRRVMARLARGGALGRVAAELGLQLDQVGEHVGLAAQFVGDHRRLARDGRDHGDADAAALHGLDQRAEIAVAGKQHDLVDMLGKLHRIDRELDVHVALDLAAAAGVDEFLGRLGDDGVAVVVQPVDQRADRRIFLILDDRGVIERAYKGAAALEFLQQALVVDVEAERLGGCVEVGAIDKKRDLVGSRGHQVFSHVLTFSARPWRATHSGSAVWSAVESDPTNTNGIMVRQGRENPYFRLVIKLFLVLGNTRPLSGYVWTLRLWGPNRGLAEPIADAKSQISLAKRPRSL